MKARIIVPILFVGAVLLGTYKESLGAGDGQSASNSQHPPYAQGMCQVCHSSETPGANDLAQEAPESCYTCHKDEPKAYMHSPASLGACLLCHSPHESENKFLLNEKIPDLCYLCHDRIQAIIDDERSVTHAPAKDDCAGCHDPHGSDINNMFLVSDMTTLCTECHVEENVPIEKYTANVTHKHQPVEEAGRCAQCHTAHASPFEFHLIAEPMDLCLKCHDEEVTAYDGKVLADMAALLKANPSHHGPILGKNCSSCHNPHGSEHFRILVNDYPAEFYTEEFALDDYNLCFTCHESTILRDKETTTLTNFRDGSRNLHFLHVNREQKGRTCRACHETHASTHPRHVRDAVPFGKINWPLELQYQVEYTDTNTGESCDTPGKTCVKTGGSCVACHKRLMYNYAKGDI